MPGDISRSAKCSYSKYKLFVSKHYMVAVTTFLYK